MRQAFKFQGKWRVKRLRADIRDVGVRKCRLNGGNALEHRSVISLRALGGLHLKSSVSVYIFIGCESQETSSRKCGGT